MNHRSAGFQPALDLPHPNSRGMPAYRRHAYGALILTALCLAALPMRAATVTLFAAASLTESVREIAADYEKATGDKIVVNFGAASALARQIEAGAPADLFFSADEAKLDELQTRGLVIEGTRRSRLSNSLVIIVSAEDGADVHTPEDLAGAKVRRVALGDPRAVPIGIYAREFLEQRKLWEAVGPKVVATENVRAALAAVEAGNADASIVYKTDARISKKVKVAFEVPAGQGPKISYPVALLKGAPAPEAAKRFLEYLLSPAADKVFEKYGFVIRAGNGGR